MHPPVGLRHGGRAALLILAWLKISGDQREPGFDRRSFEPGGALATRKSISEDFHAA